MSLFRTVLLPVWTAVALIVSVSGSSMTRASSPAGCWKVVSSPNVANASHQFFGISIADEDDIWAVGYYIDTATRPLRLHWDGDAWSIDSDGPNELGDLRGVLALDSDPDHVWTVGLLGTNTLIEQHIDSTWTNVGPSVAGFFNDIAGTSASNLWAVGGSAAGKPLVYHNDGSGWEDVTPTSIADDTAVLVGVAITTGGDVWAVGSDGNGDILTIRRQEGQWDEFGAGDGAFFRVSTSGTDVWAAGRRPTGSSAEAIVAGWNATNEEWDFIPTAGGCATPQLSEGIAIEDSDSVWISGVEGAVGSNRGFVEYWDGESFSRKYLPQLGSHSSWVMEMGAGPEGVSWALGHYKTSANANPLTLIWRFDPEATDCIPDCPETYSCSGSSGNCQREWPRNCATTNTGKLSCSLACGVLSECQVGKTIRIQQCECEAKVPGAVCPAHDQEWFCQ